MDLSNIQARRAAIEQNLTVRQALRKKQEQVVAALSAEVTTQAAEAVIIDMSEKTLLQISASVLGKSTGIIDKLVTAGLKLVFEDQNLQFKTLTDKYRGKTSIKFQLLEDGREKPLMDSYGGGVLVVAGVLLRVVTIITLGMRRILFLDESLSHLAEQYVPAASKLLQKLCRELNFVVVMVTHQPEFSIHADCHYEAKRRNGATVFDRVGGKSIVKPGEGPQVERKE